VNQSPIPVGASTTRYYRSGDRVAKTKRLDGSRGIESLAPGASSAPSPGHFVVVPNNTATLNFAKLEFGYRRTKPDGSLGPETAFKWDVSAAKPF
jgi:hypothetical protein